MRSRIRPRLPYRPLPRQNPNDPPSGNRCPPFQQIKSFLRTRASALIASTRAKSPLLVVRNFFSASFRNLIRNSQNILVSPFCAAAGTNQNLVDCS